MAKGILVTGATGFVGREVLRKASITSDDNFYVLVRSDSSENLIKDHLKHVDPDRVHILRGDLTHPYLGINYTTRQRLQDKVQEIWHMAASTSFDESKRDEIFSTNLVGTKNVLDLIKDIGGKKLIYMSTAYVCGTDQNEIPEETISPDGRSFKNPYEESKLLAENEVRSSGLPFVIIRPSIIVGDSKTGESHGETRMVYGYLRGLYQTAMMKFAKPRDQNFWKYWHAVTNGQETQEFPTRLRADPATTKNFVTLDDVVNCTFGIVNDPNNNTNKTYSVVNGTNLTMTEIVNAMQQGLRIRGIQQIPNWKKTDDATFAEKAAMKTTKPYWPYTHVSEPKWQEDNTKKLGIKRIQMTSELFQFLMDTYIEKELKPNGNSHN